MVESSESSDIEHQIAELQEQQLKTIALLEKIQQQLSDLTIKSNKPAKSPPRELQIGDKVQILNPRRGQPSRGTIARISSHFVFIETQPGHQVRRAVKNVRRL